MRHILRSASIIVLLVFAAVLGLSSPLRNHQSTAATQTLTLGVVTPPPASFCCSTYFTQLGFVGSGYDTQAPYMFMGDVGIDGVPKPNLVNIPTAVPGSN